ncbi:hypothetical protein CR159_01480 [Pollutimonas subterranea]|uniref:Toxin CptA n=1 Tax=Pollutimonas subterranea TaxID=2045210 RepID=A0A2N4U9M6_9BURK|nr:hypothetical protein [Pollutimonas subterranea]PLC51724.1 hypothetical protein CR159_01480 [Pollutimonas subterranea]
MVRQWPVQRPRWVRLLGMAACFGGLFALAYAGWPLVSTDLAACVLALAALALAGKWTICRMTDFPAQAGTLSLRDGGLWEVTLYGTTTTMCLTHAWPAFAWMTLQLRETAGASSKPIEVTIWRSTVSGQAWNELCVHVARQVAMPGRVLQKESL